MMIAELAETIIPKTDLPGAKDLSAHLFVLTMIDDCYEKKDQDTFMEGMKDFEKHARKKFDKSFTALSKEEKISMLNEMESLDKKTSSPAAFYGEVKKLTMQAYTSSQFYLTSVEVYELVPARFQGCIPLKQAS
jgi:hypothetical protein